MNLENALYYVTHHSESIIQWLFLAVVVISTLIVAGGIFKKRKAASLSSGSSLGSEQGAEIQAALQRLLEQTSKLENVTLTGAAPGVVADVDAQVKTLRSELSARESEIATLKAGTGVADAATGVAEGLAVRVKELESKLAEYEILEDDIADLSLFKDENSRLKAELETYKAGGAAPAPVEAQATETLSDAAVDPSAVTSADLIVEEFAQVIQQKAEPATDPLAAFNAPAPEPVAAAPAPAPAPAPEPELTMPTSVPPKAASNPFAAAPAAGAASAGPAVPEEANDLFAEFSVDAPPDEDALDTSKMMAEMDALSAIEPSATDSLEGAIDTDKMAMEATSLSKA